MLSALKGGTLWAALAVILAAVGAVTALAWHGSISGSDALIVITAVVTAVTGVTSAHVAGQTAAAAFNAPPPVNGGTTPLAQPGAGSSAAAPAMPQPGGQ